MLKSSASRIKYILQLSVGKKTTYRANCNKHNVSFCAFVGAASCRERRCNAITSVQVSVGLPRCLGKASGFGLLLESESSAGRARGQLAGREILQLAWSKEAILEPQLG